MIKRLRAAIVSSISLYVALKLNLYSRPTSSTSNISVAFGGIVRKKLRKLNQRTQNSSFKKHNFGKFESIDAKLETNNTSLNKSWA